MMKILPYNIVRSPDLTYATVFTLAVRHVMDNLLSKSKTPLSKYWI